MKKIFHVLKNIGFMLRYSWKHARSRYFVAAVSILLDTFQPLFTLMMPKYIIDELTYGKDFDKVLFYIALLVGINLIVGVIRSAVSFIGGTSKLRCNHEFEKHYGVICADMEYSALESSSTRDEINKAINNTNPVRFIDGTLSGFLTTLFQLTGYTYIIFTLNPVIILIIIFIIFLSSLINKRRQKLGYDYESIFSKYERKFKYLMNCMITFDFGKEVRINKASWWLSEKFEGEIDVYLEILKENLKKNLKLNIIDTVIGFLQTVIMYGYAVYKILINAVTVGSFSVYLGAITAFTGGFTDITGKIMGLGLLSKYVDDYKKVTSKAASTDDGGICIDPRGSKSHEITFENVYFKYPNTENYVLKNINVTVKAGEKLSVVGYNGAGKTTFIKLICRLYEPTEGRILYNGIDVSKINKKSYMKLLSVVFQDYSLFYFTLRDNVVFDKGDDKKFLDAIEKSGLHEKFGELELGEHTPLTKEFDPRGIEFSGGEGQKLACARAYYKDAPIIIFDEPTAALDPIAESALYERFNNIIENKTAVYISHRLASVRFCDKVAVFVGGEIAEYGTHDTLMEKNGIYRDMFEKQSGFYAEGENDEEEKI
ncbi:MAG: ABC transporter ATP-binding protein [Ruminococcaceae bacterium]|nr:ABC transporter ATP-binding protein [Oscillospiraceae bacterium]